MTEDFDLIMLDVMLPDVSGLRIVQALRENHNHTPVLFLSARDSVDDRVKGLELGADDYLIKPVTPAMVQASRCARWSPFGAASSAPRMRPL